MDAGAHNSCICIIHGNPERMIDSSCLSSEAFKGLVDDDSGVTALNLVKTILCETPTRECHLGECPDCKNSHLELERKLLEIFDRKEIEEVTYESWCKVGKVTQIEVKTEDVELFAKELCKQLNELRTHDFIYKQQEKFFSQTKDNLKVGESLLVTDFAENYVFVEQNAVASAYYHQVFYTHQFITISHLKTLHFQHQCTLFPAVLYYNRGNGTEKLTMCVISDSLEHSPVVVSSFLDKVEEHIRDIFPQRVFQFNFSDGAPTQVYVHLVENIID